MQYLLGDLSEDEKTGMEEAFFADDSKFETLELAEDELIDAYVRNELSPEDHQKFKLKLLRSPRLVDRVNFATALAEKVDFFPVAEVEAPIEPRPSFRPSAIKPKTGWWKGFFTQQPAFVMGMAACILLILVAGALLLSSWVRLRNQSEQLANERALLQRQKEELDKQSAEQRAREAGQQAQDVKPNGDLQPTDKQLKEEPVRQPTSTFAIVSLTPGSLRSGGGSQRKLIIGSDTLTARIQLALQKNEYPVYKVTIQTVDDAVVFRQDKLKPQNNRSGSQLQLSVPARRLPPGDYTVNLEGVTASGRVESVDDYAFRVVTSQQ